MTRSFEDLVAEAEAEPVEGWDFSWLNGRATEERPSWGYSRMLVGKLAASSTVLDIQTGGGEVLAEALEQAGTPVSIAATDSWPPNIALARKSLEPFSATVAEVPDHCPLPFPDNHFELVVSRHPTVTVWPEIGRVLQPGGTYFSQQVGPGTNHELTEFMMGPQPISGRRSPERARREAEDAGLHVTDLRSECLAVRFYDIGAVVYFLRKVIWTVPDFTVAGYLDRLRALHEQITTQGSFVSHARRFLIEAHKPI